MIRIERNPAFWERIANHPEVAPNLLLGAYRQDMSAIVGSPRVIPLATQLGGFIFIGLDPLGGLYEGHRMFVPEGCGRHAFWAATQAANFMFTHGASMITAREREGVPSTRPSRSFGFKACAPFDNKHRLWSLTRIAWESSPARRRAVQWETS